MRWWWCGGQSAAVLWLLASCLIASVLAAPKPGDLFDGRYILHKLLYEEKEPEPLAGDGGAVDFLQLEADSQKRLNWPLGALARYTDQRDVNKGSFGNVWLVKDTGRGDQYIALKLFLNRATDDFLQYSDASWSDKEKMRRECAWPTTIQARMPQDQRKELFIECLGSNLDNSKSKYMYLELTLGGTEQLKDTAYSASFTKALIKPIVYQMVSALDYLTKDTTNKDGASVAKLIHHDLKDINVMSNGKFTADEFKLKVVDLGELTYCTEADSANSLAATGLWAPPEWVKSTYKGFCPPSRCPCSAFDMYSVGVMFGDLFRGSAHLFGSYLTSQKDTVGTMNQTAFDSWITTWNTGSRSSWMTEARLDGGLELMRQMLVSNPALRITPAQALAHRYLRPLEDARLEVIRRAEEAERRRLEEERRRLEEERRRVEEEQRRMREEAERKERERLARERALIACVQVVRNTLLVDFKCPALQSGFFTQPDSQLWLTVQCGARSSLRTITGVAFLRGQEQPRRIPSCNPLVVTQLTEVCPTNADSACSRDKFYGKFYFNDAEDSAALDSPPVTDGNYYRIEDEKGVGWGARNPFSSASEIRGALAANDKACHVLAVEPSRGLVRDGRGVPENARLSISTSLGGSTATLVRGTTSSTEDDLIYTKFLPIPKDYAVASVSIVRKFSVMELPLISTVAGSLSMQSTFLNQVDSGLEARKRELAQAAVSAADLERRLSTHVTDGLSKKEKALNAVADVEKAKVDAAADSEIDKLRQAKARTLNDFHARLELTKFGLTSVDPFGRFTLAEARAARPPSDARLTAWTWPSWAKTYSDSQYMDLLTAYAASHLEEDADFLSCAYCVALVSGMRTGKTTCSTTDATLSRYRFLSTATKPMERLCGSTRGKIKTLVRKGWLDSTRTKLNEMFPNQETAFAICQQTRTCPADADASNKGFPTKLVALVAQRRMGDADDWASGQQPVKQADDTLNAAALVVREKQKHDKRSIDKDVKKKLDQEKQSLESAARKMQRELTALQSSLRVAPVEADIPTLRVALVPCVSHLLKPAAEIVTNAGAFFRECSPAVTKVLNDLAPTALGQRLADSINGFVEKWQVANDNMLAAEELTRLGKSIREGELINFKLPGSPTRLVYHSKSKSKITLWQLALQPTVPNDHGYTVDARMLFKFVKVPTSECPVAI